MVQVSIHASDIKEEKDSKSAEFILNSVHK